VRFCYLGFAERKRNRGQLLAPWRVTSITGMFVTKCYSARPKGASPWHTHPRSSRQGPGNQSTSRFRASRHATRGPSARRWAKRCGRSVREPQNADEGRIPELLPLRHGRMVASPFTFYRGSALAMAVDLAGTPSTGVRVQCGGDSHLVNFRGLATPERQVIFAINDLDETLPAPWEWDLKRLAASFVIACRDNGLSESDVADSEAAGCKTVTGDPGPRSRMAPSNCEIGQHASRGALQGRTD